MINRFRKIQELHGKSEALALARCFAVINMSEDRHDAKLLFTQLWAAIRVTQLIIERPIGSHLDGVIFSKFNPDSIPSISDFKEVRTEAFEYIGDCESDQEPTELDQKMPRNDFDVMDLPKMIKHFRYRILQNVDFAGLDVVAEAHLKLTISALEQAFQFAELASVAQSRALVR